MAQRRREGTRNRGRGASDLLVGAPALEPALLAEVRRTGLRGAAVVAPGVVSVTSRADLVMPDFVFARQKIVNVQSLSASSATELADHLIHGLTRCGAESQRQWLSGELRLDVDVSDGPRLGSRPREDHPLGEGLAHLVDILEKKRVGKARKQEVEPFEGTPRERAEFLLVGAWTGYLGVAHSLDDSDLDSDFDSDFDNGLQAWPVHMAAGRAPVFTDKSAPSSAHRKLDEALVWLNDRPTSSSTVLDLGAAPGGWSHVALRHGARVIAMDRGEMSPELMATGRVIHLRKDAFAHAPLDDADWIVCDIVAEPVRTLSLLKSALACERLHAFVFTVKLRLPVDFAIVDDAAALLRDFPQFSSRIKNLFHNKVEITLMGRRRPSQ